MKSLPINAEKYSAMDIHSIFNQVPQRSIRAGASAAQDGLTFKVKMSPSGAISANKLERSLNLVTGRLMNAPYSRFIQEKAINVLVISNAEFEELGLFAEKGNKSPYVAPEVGQDRCFAGCYFPDLNAVLVNSDFIKDDDSNILEVLIHEFLHAYSSKMIWTKEGGQILRLGERGADGGSGVCLDEGLTEYLRIQTGGLADRSRNKYYPIQESIAILAKKIGDEVFYEAYFNGRVGDLQRRVDLLYGDGACNYLCYLAYYLLNGEKFGVCEPYQKRAEAIRTFAGCGFEQRMMKEWDYSPEDRRRAPREMPASKLPDKLRTAFDKAKVKGLKVFTNLTEAELDCFSNKYAQNEQKINGGSAAVVKYYLDLVKQNCLPVICMKYQGRLVYDENEEWIKEPGASLSMKIFEADKMDKTPLLANLSGFIEFFSDKLEVRPNKSSLIDTILRILNFR